MADHTPTRTDEIKTIHREYKFFYQVLGGSLLVAIGILIGAIAFSSDLDRSAYFINLYTSLLSILVTVFVIDFLNRRRELRQLQQQLIRDASSISNEIAKNAVHQLRKHGWLEGEDGLLQKMDLSRANLAGAHLDSANLKGSNLVGAHLAGAHLRGAYLEQANMPHVHLEGANLSFAHLEGANLGAAYLMGADLVGTYLERASLSGAYLEGANLWGVCLKEANLYSANLQGSKFRDVVFDETTIVPDGSRWTPDTDLTKFGCIIE